MTRIRTVLSWIPLRPSTFILGKVLKNLLKLKLCIVNYIFFSSFWNIVLVFDNIYNWFWPMIIFFFATTVPTLILLKCLPISCQKIKLNYEFFLLIFRTNVFSFYKCENGMLHHNALWFFCIRIYDWLKGLFSIFRPSGNYLTLNGPYIYFNLKLRSFYFLA